MYFEGGIVLALLLDQLFGDPRWFPHPVKLIGLLSVFLEERLRRVCGNPKFAGLLTALLIVIITMTVTTLLVTAAFYVHPVCGFVVSIAILYTTIAAKDLKKHSEEVFHCLYTQKDLVKARAAVGMIVGRDTTSLDEDGVSKACVETVAENMVDGVTAPLFYAVVTSMFFSASSMAVGAAAVGAMMYKAINTMDSMFGYKNYKYLHFGWAAAKIDDVANFIPARLSGIAIIPAAAILQLDWKGAARILKRDRLKHASPNAAHSEAAVAGALGLQLAGDATYFGKVVSKPALGDNIRSISPWDIQRTNRLMLLGSLLFVFFLLLVKRVVVFL